MSLFNSHTPFVRCGAIIDIGSGSVGIAVVVSDSMQGKLDIVWSYREHMLIRDVRDGSDILKQINTALINAFLELGNGGVKALHKFDPSFRIEYIQTALCAPWAYTVTKTILYENKEPFMVTEELIEQLIAAAKKQTLATQINGKPLDQIGLRMITDATISIELNGYAVEDCIGKKSASIALSHIHALAEEKIIATLEGSKEKILPKAKSEYYSFMYLFYQTLKGLHPNTLEVCLIDVTNEATEIGIVRNNILTHTSYMPVGLYTLAREFAAACKIPKEEAYALLKDGEATSQEYSQAQLAQIEEITADYENKLEKLFAETGDDLSIPKTLFLHTSTHTESFFSKRCSAAARKVNDSKPALHLFTSELLGTKTMSDTALALSVHHFHTDKTM